MPWSSSLADKLKRSWGVGGGEGSGDGFGNNCTNARIKLFNYFTPAVLSNFCYVAYFGLDSIQNACHCVVNYIGIGRMLTLSLSRFLSLSLFSFLF